MMAFPAFKEIKDLYITVDVGFVDGIRATTTPTGTATSKKRPALSSRIIPTVFRFSIAS
ncbi:unknown [Firmicutes bacterium CAG:238]|nr:unknown [Firmicutes bacterium CAG:238]